MYFQTTMYNLRIDIYISISQWTKNWKKVLFRKVVVLFAKKSNIKCKKFQMGISFDLIGKNKISQLLK